MKTLLATIAALLAIGCISPFQPEPEIIGQTYHHMVTTGSITTGVIRWKFSATGGALWVKRNESDQWSDIKSIESVSILWKFDECKLAIIDPAAKLAGCYYKLSVWR